MVHGYGEWWGKGLKKEKLITAHEKGGWGVRCVLCIDESRSKRLEEKGHDYNMNLPTDVSPTSNKERVDDSAFNAAQVNACVNKGV